jgi:hypothetical protein
MEKAKIFLVLILILSSKINCANQDIHLEYSDRLPEKTPIAPPGSLPSQKPPAPTQQDFEAEVAALREHRRSVIRSYDDNNEWAKVYSYNSGPSGAYEEKDKNSPYSFDKILKTLFVPILALILAFVLYKDYKKLKE